MFLLDKGDKAYKIQLFLMPVKAEKGCSHKPFPFLTLIP